MNDMKKILLLASLFTACAIEAFAYNVYAPNSFDTVCKGNYAYKTVYTMCEQGKAPDYTTAFFDRQLTRYELAGVIKDILEGGKTVPEDNPSLMKLRKDYARELEALGWKPPKRQPSKEKPILEIGGDSRIRYNNGGDADARVRVAGRWNITDNTSIQAGGEKNVE